MSNSEMTPAPTNPEPGTSTWKRYPLFDPAQIAKSTQISAWERLRLLFVRSQYAYEPPTWIRYKKLNGVTFILEVHTAGGDK